jgi:colanic acid biosynthesis glycosyl transferase WcaI
MRILILTQYFFPEPNTKGFSLARELAERGHQVEVLTGFPNYPGGKLYEGYRIRPLQEESIEGIRVLRVALYPSHDSSSIKRVFNYVSFAISAALFGVWSVQKADVMYVYHPPATIALPAIVLKLLRRIPIVYEIQDLWPDALQSTGMLTSRRLLGLIDAYCRLSYRFFDRIAVISPGFKAKLSQRGVAPSKIQVIYNWGARFDVPEVEDPVLKAELGFNGRFTVLFAGNMGKAQALENVIHAASILQCKNANIQVAFIGDGVEVKGLKALSDRLDLGNVVFLNSVPASEIGKILKCADVLLVHLRKDPLFKLTIPSKIPAYLKVGKPVLVAAEGEARQLIASSGAGIPCEPENAEDIAAKILQLYEMSQVELNDMGARGRAYYHANLTVESGMQKYLELFKQVC